jgi:16S rRNA (cytidine1402-2'-O)-methyltransferase
LSAAGLPVSKFFFEGFLPRSSSQRKAFFTEKLWCEYTWIFYESSHRILACLQDMSEVFPLDREIVVAREITKLHETIVKTTLGDALNLVANDENMRKGEFVVIVDGATVNKQYQAITAEQEKILKLLMRECSIKTAVSLAVEITGLRKKLLYQTALAIENAAGV